MKLILVHNWLTEKWYIANSDTPETPFTIQPTVTHEELRWEICHVEMALNGKITVIDVDGKEVTA